MLIYFIIRSCSNDDLKYQRYAKSISNNTYQFELAILPLSLIIIIELMLTRNNECEFVKVRGKYNKLWFRSMLHASDLHN